MAKSRFPLEMADGTKVRTLEELRVHFDEENVLGYFEDGMLTRWLEDRFYEDEAEALRKIDKNASDYPRSLWEALGISSAIVGLDEEAAARLAEKQEMLRDRTDDPVILSRAPQTAFDQEDLADLLDRGENMIYLCGKEFRIPLQPHVTYEGILGTPKIIVKKNLEQKLQELGIVFVSVELPWGKADSPSVGTTSSSAIASDIASTRTWLVPREQLKAMAAATFKEDFERYKIESYPTFLMVDEKNGTAVSDLTDAQKNAAISLICGTDYTEGDIVHLRISDDMSEGWAFTADSFCIVARASMGIRDEQIAMNNIYSHSMPSEWAGERKLTMKREEEIVPYTSLSKPIKKIKKEIGNMCHVFGYYSNHRSDSRNSYSDNKQLFHNAVRNGEWTILNNHGLFLLDGSGIIWYDEMFGYRKDSGTQNDDKSALEQLEEELGGKGFPVFFSASMKEKVVMEMKSQKNRNDSKEKRKKGLGTWPLVRFLSNMKNIFQRKVGDAEAEGRKSDKEVLEQIQ